MLANSSDPAINPAPPVATDNRTRIHVANVYALNAFWQQAGPRRCLVVAQRTERRDGQYWALGGLAWTAIDGGLVVTTITGEDEQLPDLPVVRDGWPFAFPNEPTGMAA